MADHIALKFLLILQIWLFNDLAVLAAQTAQPPSHPFPSHTSYASGTIKPNHRTQAQLDQDVSGFYAYWKSRYLIQLQDSPPSYRISSGTPYPERTVSEGQGFGMIIVALMAGYDPDARSIYDGLWNFVREHPSNIDQRLMAWEVPEGAGGESSAFDGDADIAYSLLLADVQWGSFSSVNYRAEAMTLISAIKESTIGPESHLPLLGDWVDPHGGQYNQFTPRSSDFMPDHFLAFSRISGDPFWDKTYAAVQSAISGLQADFSKNTGLLPDFMQPLSDTDNTLRPADPHFLEGPYDGAYYYNAGRDPWRIGTNALVNNDALSLHQAQRMAEWIAEKTMGDPAIIKAGYSLAGLPIGDYFTTFFAAPFGVALMTTPSQQEFLNAVYDSVSSTHENYYEDSVTLLCLLVMSGNYWSPAPQIHEVTITPSLLLLLKEQ